MKNPSLNKMMRDMGKEKPPRVPKDRLWIPPVEEFEPSFRVSPSMFLSQPDYGMYLADPRLSFNASPTERLQISGNVGLPFYLNQGKLYDQSC